MIARDAQGFIYVVSSLGVTGTRSNIKTDLASIVDVIRESTSIPAQTASVFQHLSRAPR